MEKEVHNQINERLQVPAICAAENSPFSFVEQKGSVTLLHYEGHADNLQQPSITPLFWTAIAILLK